MRTTHSFKAEGAKAVIGVAFIAALALVATLAVIAAIIWVAVQMLQWTGVI